MFKTAFLMQHLNTASICQQVRNLSIAPTHTTAQPQGTLYTVYIWAKTELECITLKSQGLLSERQLIPSAPLSVHLTSTTRSLVFP